MSNPARLRGFIQSFTRLIEPCDDEERIFADGKVLLSELIGHEVVPTDEELTIARETIAVLS